MATARGGKSVIAGIREDYLKFLSREIAMRWKKIRGRNDSIAEEGAVSLNHGSHPAETTHAIDLKSMCVDKLCREIRQLDDTRGRILSGEIEPGVCEDCGDPIPLGRLAKVPWATRDFACETAREQAQKKIAPSSRYNRKRPIAYLRAI